MRIADSEVQQLLSKNQRLMTLMTDLKTKKEFPNVFLGTPYLKKYEDVGLTNIVPYLRINLVPDDQANYADNQRIAEFPSVQVDFWVKTEDIKSYKEISELIYEILSYAGWERTYFNAYVDNDVRSLRMITSRFKYIG